MRTIENDLLSSFLSFPPPSICQASSTTPSSFPWIWISDYSTNAFKNTKLRDKRKKMRWNNEKTNGIKCRTWPEALKTWHRPRSKAKSRPRKLQRSGDRPRPRCKANSMQGSSRYWPSRGASLIILGSCVKILFFSQDQFFGLISWAGMFDHVCERSRTECLCVCLFVRLLVCSSNRSLDSGYYCINTTTVLSSNKQHFGVL